MHLYIGMVKRSSIGKNNISGNKLYNKPGARFRGEKQYGHQPTNQRTDQLTEWVIEALAHA
jgi:hypothetical protein